MAVCLRGKQAKPCLQYLAAIQCVEYYFNTENTDWGGASVVAGEEILESEVVEVVL